MIAADAAGAGEGPVQAALEEESNDLTMRHGARFAGSVVGIMFSEQMLLNAGVLIVAAKTGGGDLTTGIVGFVFNVMLIVRAPLQLFQAIQTSILPHLAGLEAREGAAEFHKAIRTTVMVIAAFATLRRARAAAHRAGGHDRSARRQGRVLVRACRAGGGRARDGPAPHLGDAEPGRARPRPCAAGGGRVAVSAAVFVAFVATGSGIGDAVVTRVEVGYFGATAILCTLLWLLYRRGPARLAAGAQRQPGVNAAKSCSDLRATRATARPRR